MGLTRLGILLELSPTTLSVCVLKDLTRPMPSIEVYLDCLDCNYLLLLCAFNRLIILKHQWLSYGGLLKIELP